MPRAPKPSHLRQNRERKDFGEVTVIVRAEIPDPPAGLLPEIEEQWRLLWSSPISQTYAWEADNPDLQWLFKLYSQRERYQRLIDETPLIQGPQGTPVDHPLNNRVDKISAEIRKLGADFGLRPMNRLKLGVTFGQARDTLEEMSRRMRDRTNGRPDPRIVSSD